MDVNDLLYQQALLAEEIKKTIINFKKDGPSRRTPEHIKRRLESLEKYWNEYRINHEKLSECLPVSEEYFVGDYYQQTRQCYLDAKLYIEKSSISATPQKPPLMQPNPSCVNKNLDQEKPSQPSVSNEVSRSKEQVEEEKINFRGTAQEQTTEPAIIQDWNTMMNTSNSGNYSKLDEMFKRQLSNFKAFSRTVSNINIGTMQERWEFEDTLKALQARWKAIDLLHWEIDSETNGSNLQYEARFTEHEQKYYDIKKAINSKLWSVSHREKSTPQLDIPIFNGNYQQWVSFKDLFSEAIHNNPSLSNAQRMQFLKSKLKGEAERLVQHLQISSENYTACWEILNHRYNNKKLIFTTHMNTMMSLPITQQANANHIKRLHDTTTECLNAIKNLGVNIDTWDPILVYILVQKIDAETHSDYLESLKEPRELPNLNEFLKFLENKFTTMESARRKQENYQQRLSTASASNRQGNSYYFKNFSSNKAISQSNSRNKVNCPICNSTEHGIYFCKQFLEMFPTQKKQAIAKLNLCFNCLYNHNGKTCMSTKRCRECNGNHNTLLHSAYAKNNLTPLDMTSRSAANNAESNRRVERSSNNTHVTQQCNAPEILLATALIKVQGADGKFKIMRALIDQGSQVSLITSKAAKLLSLNRQRCKGVITGVGTKDNICNGMITIKCKSKMEEYEFTTDVYVMKTLTRNLPNESFRRPEWQFLQEIDLADPHFNISKPIDILFGADIYSHIIMDGIHRIDNKTPIVQQTRLGWILCGKVETFCCNVILNNIQDLQKFWEIEDLPEHQSYSTEDIKCIEYYKSTTTRSKDGKYTVRLPLKSNIDHLGQSKYKAIAQFYQVERKLNKNNELKIAYKSFMHEYQELGHMNLISCDNTTLDREPYCYLPHHCVLRNDSSTTKLRVVFNASEKTTSGLSLNDCMSTGPNLQKDIFTLILGWRQYQVALTADCEKMFRAIWLHEDDQPLQRVMWRDTPQEPLRQYQLSTVTYGTKAAPYLAMMTLRQLASDEKERYPEAAKILENNFYMDDLVLAVPTLSHALKIKENLINLMKSGGFNLRKWRSNYQELRDENQQEQSNFNFKQNESTKTLGLHWNPEKDVFIFHYKVNKDMQDTKRTLLSAISQLFDPLGWLTPLSTKMKILFQQVWKTSMAWDDKLPKDIYQEWQIIKEDIIHINSIKIPRWLGSDATCRLELHGFCDASRKAYACVVYSKLIKSGQAEIKLIVGKSRLVPCNKEISLPRLELSGALLLSKVMMKVKKALSPDLNTEVHGWIDSTAVLGWLQGNPDRWKPFVSNRVRQIIDVMPPACWNYVKTTENPADCASRGLITSQLIKHSLWWQGPTWLAKQESFMQEKLIYSTNEEARTLLQANVITQDENSIIKEMIEKYSSLTKLLRVLTWVYRFMTRKQDKNLSSWLSISELRKTRNRIIRHVQEEIFGEEIDKLKQKKLISTKSKILNLNPFLDSDGILRVGGRLRNACISPDMKNPIILPQNHRFTELIINNAHELTLHGGARLTLAFTRQKYWIISGTRTTKKYIHRCVTCKKQKPSMQEQIMGDLPEARVRPSRPFQYTGVDFTGHVFLKANKGRGIKTTKGYVSVFVCMATKAVHLELVSDLTTSSFIAALRRMAARRGTPSDIYCDNGRNFVGASRSLQEEYEDILHTFNDDLQQELTNMEITFHFNAPAWPSAGGLWEAAVKSFKFHLKRVIGEQKLTYEEFSTMLTQIEACLNSRPLCALTDDPEDLNYLTPSHFLTSGPLLTLIPTERDLRTRWCLTQKITQDLWKRWNAEYLSQLTSRSKWKKPKENIKINDVVVIHEENLPPGKWVMGRVMELHPGKDGYVRVVTLKTKSGYVKRPVIKLSKLIDQDENFTNTKQDLCNNTINSDQAKSKQSREIGTRKTKMNFFTTMITTFLLFLSLFTNSEANVNVTKFRENQGLYFDKLSNMFLIKNEWKIIVYYEMEPYLQGSKALDSYIQTLDETCKTMQGQSHCAAIVLQLRHGHDELEHYNQLLLHQQFDAVQAPDRQRRIKRGLIDGVGNLANSLFGILDSRFAEQYKKDIDLLQQNQHHIINLWKNQTTIVEAENNLLKRMESAMNKQHKIINQHMISLDKALVELRNAAKISNINNDFTIGSIIAINLQNNLKELQNTLLDTIMDVYQGRFNLHLVAPNQLIKELNIISSKVPKDVSLPIDNLNSDIRKLYHLIKVKARMMQEYLLFEMSMPLISRETYEIFKLVPVPTHHERKTFTILPVSDYVALNIRKDTFIPMSEADIKACYVQDTYLCHSQRPIYHMKNDKNLCIQENEECVSRVTLCKNTWQESYIANTYIYTCCEQCNVRTMCYDQITAHQLMGTGLISIGHGCIIKTEQFMIYPHMPHRSEIKLAPNLYTPTIAPINHIINISIPQYNLTNQAHSIFQEEASAIQGRIEKLKDTELPLNSVTYHDIHHYAMIYIILAILAVIALAIVAKRIRCIWSRPRRREGQTSAEETQHEAAAGTTPAPTPVPRPTGGSRRPPQTTRDRQESEITIRPIQLRNRSTSPVLRKFNEMFQDDAV